MNHNKKNSFALLGASKTGISISYHLSKKGYIPAFCWNRSSERLKNALKYIDFKRYSTDLKNLPQNIDFMIISISDDAIESLVQRLCKLHYDLNDIIIFHTSGAIGSKALSPLKKIGAKTGAFHPFISIPDIETGISLIPETLFTCEGDIANWLKNLAEKIGKIGIIVTEKQKLILHTVAVFLLNYTVGLATEIKKLMSTNQLEIENFREDFNKIFSNKFDSSITNNFKKEISGPILRGDYNIIKKHIEILEEYPELKSLYLLSGKIICQKLIENKMPMSENIKKIFM
ncbi:MAG: DUF2520 domain-containing protein [Candidatus Marinimicrobia bacterium]|nr:DUF2520 domain-containing protein [Candidatus Neomarinimicrobiota bacterium]